jgi:hypothetical protein
MPSVLQKVTRGLATTSAKEKMKVHVSKDVRRQKASEESFEIDCCFFDY